MTKGNLRHQWRRSNDYRQTHKQYFNNYQIIILYFKLLNYILKIIKLAFMQEAKEEPIILLIL